MKQLTEDGKMEGASRNALKSKMPMTEGRFKKFARKAALALGIAAASGSLALTQNACGTGYGLHDNEDASTEQRDSGVPDAVARDGSSQDARADSGTTLDSGLSPDATVDAGPTCEVFNQAQPMWLLQINSPDSIGGYSVVMSSLNGNDAILDITCASTNEVAASGEVFTAGVAKTISLQVGGKSFTATVTGVFPNIIQLSAEVGDP